MSNQSPGTVYAGNPPQNYERYFVPAIGAPVADDLMRVAALRPGERVLDVACGTGVVTRRAAQAVGRNGSVTGLDLNPGMLAVARSVGVSDAPIEWVEGNAQDMPLPDDAFDVVLCQMGLQFVADKPAALREMRRVLVSGGRIALNLPGPSEPLFQAMAESLGHHIGPQAAGFVHAVFSLHDTGQIRDLLTDAGLRNVQVQAEQKSLHLPPPQEFLWQYVHATPLAGIVAEADAETRAALEHDVVAAWHAFRDDGGMVCAQRVVHATAQK